MSIILTNNLEFSRYQSLNRVIQNLASAPSSPVEGLEYYDTTLNQLGYYNGSTWVYTGSGGGIEEIDIASANGFAGTSDDDPSNPIITLTTTITGILKGNGTAISAASAGTDYVTASSTNTFTNKTIDANGTGNSISNIEVADLASGVLNTSTSLSGASDTQVPSALAVKTYADSLLGAADAFTLKGAIDASSNPNYPAANAGDTYKISVAGRIGGGSGPLVTIGDTIYAIADGLSAGTHASVGASWVILQANVDTATDTTQGLVELATLAEAEAKSDTTRALTAASIANFPIKKIFTIGDGSTTAITCTHSLGTKDVIISVRQASDDVGVLVDWTATSTSVVTITFAVAPASNAYKVTIIG